MRKIFYNYYVPMKNLFKFESDIEKFNKWVDFRKQWDTDQPLLVIIPLSVFDLVGLDIRFVFREFGRHNNVRFLLMGTNKQIEFALSQNERFLGNLVSHVVLPMDFSVLEQATLKKIDDLMKQKKGK